MDFASPNLRLKTSYYKKKISFFFGRNITFNTKQITKDTPLELVAKGSFKPLAADSRNAHTSLVGVFEFKRFASSINGAVGSAEPRSVFNDSNFSSEFFSYSPLYPKYLEIMLRTKDKQSMAKSRTALSGSVQRGIIYEESN